MTKHWSRSRGVSLGGGYETAATGGRKTQALLYIVYI